MSYLKKELQEMTSLKDDLQALIDDKPKIGKIINEQQKEKCLKRLHRAEIKDNVFITGIPNKMTVSQNLQSDDFNGAIDMLNNFLIDVHKNAKIVRSANDNESILSREISDVDLLFDIYLDKSSNDFSEEEVQHAFDYRPLLRRPKFNAGPTNDGPINAGPINAGSEKLENIKALFFHL